MLDLVWGILLGVSLLWGTVQGRGEQVAAAALTAAGDGVRSALDMAGAMAFFCGCAAILQRAGAMRFLSRLLRRPLTLLLGRGASPDAIPYAAMNLAANMLGLGNAATPMGMEAARRLAWEGRATNALCMLLIINSSSVQLMPSSVIALRAAAGSAAPGAVILPAFFATGISTLAGIAACKLAEGRS